MGNFSGSTLIDPYPIIPIQGGNLLEDFDQLALTWDNVPRRTQRAKAAAIEIINSIPNLNQMSGLEFGCGTGLLSFNLQPYLKHITLVDNSEGMLSILKQKIQKANIENMVPLKIDLTTNNVPDINSDIIYTLMTMHHIGDIDRMIKTFHKIIKPGGYLYIADLDEEDGSYHGKEIVEHNGFNREQLTKTIASNGFYNVSNKICCEIIKKSDDGREKKYPVFIMSAQKG